MGPVSRNTGGSGSLMSVSTKRHRIAKLAREHPKRSFVSLAHHLDEDWMEEAFRRTRKDGATGVDGQTAAQYKEGWLENLPSLLGRVKSGSYQAPPVRRGYVPKSKAEKRPIGIPTFEDKILQRAVAMVLEPICEQDFLDCSYAFRTRRSPHAALKDLRRQIRSMGGCWLLDVDVRKYFDTLVHSHLREFLRRRVRDGVIRRLVDKWLKAGVWEKGRTHCPEEGTPQGGVISPLLSNLYLHVVLDLWFEQVVKPRLEGDAFLIRFADDFVMGFSSQEDALRVLKVLPKRLGKYGLAIHPGKTRLVRFVHPWQAPHGEPGPETFDFLGFTHYWGKTRRGGWAVRRKTARDRLRRSLKRFAHWCRKNRHLKVRVQHAALVRKLKGHYGYYGIAGNSRGIRQFQFQAKKIWRKWLNRRSRRKSYNWRQFDQLMLSYPLPPARVVHRAS